MLDERESARVARLPDPPEPTAKLPGDPAALRGFPIISQQALSGAILGTSPDAWVASLIDLGEP